MDPWDFELTVLGRRILGFFKLSSHGHFYETLSGAQWCLLLIFVYNSKMSALHSLYHRYDLTRLMIGSEGTLGVITEITLRLQKLPQCSVVLLSHACANTHSLILIPPNTSHTWGLFSPFLIYELLYSYHSTDPCILNGFGMAYF